MAVNVDSVSSSSQVFSMQQVQSDPGSSELSISWKLPLVYAPHYHFKIFRSKGAVLVLLWSFAAQFVVQFSTLDPDRETSLNIGENEIINPAVIFTMCMLLYPILGWLGDVKYTGDTYRVIKGSLWTLWVMSILSITWITKAHSTGLEFFLCTYPFA